MKGAPGHPDPRPDASEAILTVPSEHADSHRVEEAYRRAKLIPEVLAALHCHCDCWKRFGHRSLLACFETGHAASCDICLVEASLAFSLVEQGRSLEEIRDEVDRWFSG